MIRFYLLALAVLAAGAGAAFYLHAETGYVLVSYRDWIVETSLLGLVVGVAAAVLFVYYGFKLLSVGIRLPDIIRRSLERRRAERARDSFEAGLLQLLEGHWKRAEIELVRRAADHHASHLNYLGAARAAQRVGAGERRDHYLRLAMQNAPELEFAAQLTQAELQRERGEHRLARDTALKLRRQHPDHPYAVELLAESYAATGEWEPLRQLLADTAKLDALAPERYRELMLRALGELTSSAVRDARLDRLKAIWEAAGERFRAEPQLRDGYARGLARLNAEADALSLITATLNKEWDAGLVLLYGSLHEADAVSHLATIEQWLGRYGEKPELLATAGRVCLRNKLWGKARSYLEAALRLTPTPAAYLALAQLCEQTQNPDDAAKFYRQGLDLAAQG
ncbi:MAG: heme biosynthesis HemY N-terminal domain-containing protein [Stenotrophobium sp.]